MSSAQKDSQKLRRACTKAAWGLSFWIGRMPDSEMKQSGIELRHCAGKKQWQAKALLCKEAAERIHHMPGILCSIAFILVLLMLWVILYDTHHFVMVRYCLTSPKLKKETRLVMLSDLHNYQYGRENSQLLDAIKKEQPDMIVIAGDMITAHKKEKIDHTMALLKKLKEQYPLYYAFGNHEQKIMHYPERYGNMNEKFAKALKESGIEPYRNARVRLPDRGIDLYGAEIGQAYYQRFNKRPMEEDYLDTLLGKPDPSAFCLLLAHNPDYFPEYAKWGADLVLAGHIHGGIVRLPFFGGVIAPSMRLFPKYDGGAFYEGDSVMFLGRGIGTHSPNVRLFNPGELIVVDLKPMNRQL